MKNCLTDSQLLTPLNKSVIDHAKTFSKLFSKPQHTPHTFLHCCHKLPEKIKYNYY